MAYAKKTAKNEAYQKLKTDLKEGNPLGNAYLFYGEESYLREYYLGRTPTSFTERRAIAGNITWGRSGKD